MCYWTEDEARGLRAACRVAKSISRRSICELIRRKQRTRVWLFRRVVETQISQNSPVGAGSVNSTSKKDRTNKNVMLAHKTTLLSSLDRKQDQKAFMNVDAVIKMTANIPNIPVCSQASSQELCECAAVSPT